MSISGRLPEIGISDTFSPSHVLSSVYLGDNEYGYPKFDTTRSEIGEALYQLKYRGDWSQVAPLAAQVAERIVPLFDKVELIIPMPASNVRQRQPVNEIAMALGHAMGVPVIDDIVVKVARDTGGSS